MKLRPVVFLVLAVVIFFIPRIPFYLMPRIPFLGYFLFPLGYSQGSQLFRAILLALIYISYPVVCSRILSLILLIPLGLVAIVEWVLWMIPFALICVAEIALPVVLFLGGGYWLGGYVGASIGTILLITVLLSFGWNSFLIVAQTAQLGSEWGRQIKQWYFPWPEKLMKKIWQGATKLGYMVGGDIMNEPILPGIIAFFGAVVGLILTFVVWNIFPGSLSSVQDAQTTVFVWTLVIAFIYFYVFPKLSPKKKR